MGEKFKHSGKIHWGEKKYYILGDVERGKALVATAPRSLLILHIYFSCFQENAGCLSNYPTTFLIFPRAVLGPPPNQSISCIFRGFMPLCYSILFPDFPFMVSILAPTVHASKFCSIVWLLLSMNLVDEPPCTISASSAQKPSKGISPLLFILPSPHLP